MTLRRLAAVAVGSVAISKAPHSSDDGGEDVMAGLAAQGLA